MRRLVLATLTVSLGLILPSIARAQAPADTLSTLSTGANDQAKPPTTTPPVNPPATAAQAPATPTFEAPHSLFDQTWHQFQFGGRLSNIDGDPARFQRYQDLRDGVLFT